MKRTPLARLAVVVVVAVAACGDADTTPVADTTPTTEAAPTSAPEAQATTPADPGGGSDTALRYPGTADADLGFRVVRDLGLIDDPTFGVGLTRLDDPEVQDDELVVGGGPDDRLAYALGPVELDGSIVEWTEAAPDAFGNWSVVIRMTDAGGAAFDELAERVTGRQLAIISNGVVWSAPTIQQATFNGTAVISGDFVEAEADELARLIAGADG